MDRAGALAVHGAEAVRARVAAAQDHHVLVARGDEVRVGDRRRPRSADSGAGRNSIAKWMPSSSRPGMDEVARLARAPGQEQRVVLLAQALGIDVDAHVGPVTNSTPSARIMVEAPVERALLHLELGDPVPQEPADPVGALEHA